MSIMVFHHKNTRDSLFYERDGEIFNARDVIAQMEVNPNGHSDYEYVATVETDDMDDAYRLTNNIDKPWSQNPDVTCIKPKVRSTSVGDVFVCKDGLYVVASFGFDQVRKFHI